MILLNVLVDSLIDKQHGHGTDELAPKTKKSTRESLNQDLAGGVSDGPTCCSDDPAKRLNDVQRMANVLEHESEDAANEATTTVQTEVQTDESLPPVRIEAKESTNDQNVDEENVEAIDEAEEAQRLHKMGLNTAIAIGLHNFPEGLATFVAALDDPKVGAVLAVAIAIHNIPEGLCVALPIYYASGNRMKGFFWALLSGASEFIAALLGWAILANVFSETTYAILFGVVAGMMIMISMKELLPTAHVYDNGDTVVSYSFIVGMVVMALSLCLFQV